MKFPTRQGRRPWVIGVTIGLAILLVVGALVLGIRVAGQNSASDSSPSASGPVAHDGAAVGDPGADLDHALLSADKVGAALDAVGVRDGYSVVVRDLGTGETLSDTRGSDAVIPASSMKLMTTAAVIDKLGADHQFTTTVVSQADGSVTLVGGGDPLLSSTPSSYGDSTVTPATTQELAQRTAEALKAKGITSVSLGYDDSLFSGATRHPDWVSGDMAYVNDISALLLDEGGGSTTPSASAATTFASQLAAAGVTVTGTPSARTAGADAEELASVKSMPLSQIVSECLRHSDNTIAEMLFRQLASAYGLEASFDGGADALKQAMEQLGVWADADSLHDGSGLSVNDRLTASSLSQLVVTAAGRDDLRSALIGLPVAGVTGSLDDRFLDAESGLGAGLVRAKTGTLDTASALVGYTPTADGGMAVFALVGNGVGAEVRPYLDQLASSLSGCACAQ